MNWRMIVAGGMISTALLFSPTHTHAKEVTVKKGDTLYLIAQRNGTTIEAIKGINRLSGNTIYPGQIIRTTPPLATYTVVSGDSLYVISQKFKTTIETIKQINHLQSNEIYPGQRLKIPSWVKHWTYEVQPGDFLWKIGQFSARMSRKSNA